MEFPHRFDDFYNIELSAFISSIFAYGNISQIMSVLEQVFKVLGDNPHEFVLETTEKDIKKAFQTIQHRFYNSEDVFSLMKLLKKIYQNYGSLNYLFLLYYFNKDENLKNSISFFSNNLLYLSDSKSDGVRFMFPDPIKGSACKRMNLFLRWMIRKDELDFGLWEEIEPKKLVIPVDTHVASICKEIKLTSKKTVSWLMAEEITENLKKYSHDDPVKYDFAICHLGMRKMIKNGKI